MKTLCPSLFLLLLVAAGNAHAQQIALALANAPTPVISKSTSAVDPALPAVIPVVTARSAAAYMPFTSADCLLLGGTVALRFLDYKTTTKFMSDPANFREALLPSALAKSRLGLGAFEAGLVVLDYSAYRTVVRRHHRTLARSVQSINDGALAAVVGSNYYLLKKDWPSAREKNARP